MSPVSRGRKSRKPTSKKPATKRSGGAKGRSDRVGRRGDDGQPGTAYQAVEAIQALVGTLQPPGWLDPLVDEALDDLDRLLAADGPRSLEQATAELIGGYLHRILHGHDSTLFTDWTTRLVTAAERRLTGTADRRVTATRRLLYGLSSIGTAGFDAAARTALRRTDPVAGTDEPAWLRLMPRVAATGEVWLLRDAYGGRFGIVAATTYPDGTDPAVYLFDLDACGPVSLAGGGAYDDVRQAAAAWRQSIGPAAEEAQPRPVTGSADLACLSYWDTTELNIMGHEDRGLLDEWFRARRRLTDVADAMHRRHTPLPPALPPFRDIDVRPLVRAFTAWYRSRHDAAPDPVAADEIAHEWVADMLPGTQHAASPHRAAHHLILIRDWVADDPVTIDAKALLPEWVRWHGEQAGLPAHLVERAVAVARGRPLADTDCPGTGTRLDQPGGEPAAVVGTAANATREHYPPR